MARKNRVSVYDGVYHVTSGVDERKHEVLAIVAAYVAYNPVKAKIAPAPSGWKWSSYALAVKDAGRPPCRGERRRRRPTQAVCLCQ